MIRKSLRLLFFVLSIFITALGIVLITEASLGTSPISSIPIVLSLYLPWTFGEITLVLNGLFFLLEILLLRNRFPRREIFQLGVIFLFSGALDFYMPFFAFLRNQPFPMALLILLFGCAVLGFGICIEVAANVIMVPGDGIVKAIAHVGKWKLGSVKVGVDSSMVLGAVCLSTLFGGLGQFQGLGVGTLLSALCIGQFVNLFNRELGFLDKIRTL